MSDCEFTVDGLEDLINDFNKIVKEYRMRRKKSCIGKLGSGARM